MRKVNIIVLIVVMLLTTMMSVVYAESELKSQPTVQSSFEDMLEENHRREKLIIAAIENGDEIPEFDLIQIPEGNSARWICVKCESLIGSTCFADASKIEQGTHTSWGKECRRTLIYSRGGYVCQYCSNITTISGYHWCWDVHTTCSIGTQDVCTMDNS